MMNNESNDQIKDILSTIPDQLRIVEERINPSVQQEYLVYTANIDAVPYSEEAIAVKSQSLFDQSIPLKTKKETLAILAHSGTVQSYRTIEKYLESAQPELYDWSVLALQECRMFLESSLMDENTGMVMTGLGGKGNRLRYFFAIRSIDDNPFTDTQKATVELSFSDICRRLNSILEEIQVHQHYATMKVLVPLDVAVGDVIEGGIDSCNRVNSFLDIHYFTTNVEIPAAAEILDYLRGMERSAE